MMLAWTIAPWPVVGVRVGLVVAGIVLWYWTQAVLGKRVPKVAYVPQRMSGPPASATS